MRGEQSAATVYTEHQGAENDNPARLGGVKRRGQQVAAVESTNAVPACDHSAEYEEDSATDATLLSLPVVESLLGRSARCFWRTEAAFEVVMEKYRDRDLRSL